MILGEKPPTNLSTERIVETSAVSNVPSYILRETPLAIESGMRLRLRPFPVPQVFPVHCAQLRRELAMRMHYFHLPTMFLETCFYAPTLLSLLPPDVLEKIASYCSSSTGIRFGSWMRKEPHTLEEEARMLRVVHYEMQAQLRAIRHAIQEEKDNDRFMSRKYRPY